MLVTGVTEVSHLVSLVPQSWRSRDRLYRHSHSLLDLRPFPALSAHAFIGISTRDIASCERERRWFVLERPRRDTNGGSETEVTVTSKLQANAERNKEIQSLRDRLSLSVLEDGSRKAERLENFLVTSNSTVQKFLYWDFLANILPSRFLLPMPTVTTYRATSVSARNLAYQCRLAYQPGI